jgi:predicted ATP-binding protein involved in virulence
VGSLQAYADFIHGGSIPDDRGEGIVQQVGGAERGTSTARGKAFRKGCVYWLKEEGRRITCFTLYDKIAFLARPFSFSRMRIDQLTLQNFRGIREGSFEFPRAPERLAGGNGSFNLLVGPNGAGKTSILEGLAVAMSGLFLSMRGTDVRHVRREDVHVQIKMVEGQPFEAPQYPVRVTARGIVDGILLRWTRSLDEPTKGKKQSRTKDKDALEMAEASRLLGIRAIDGWNDPLPLVSYYGPDRLWNEPKDMQKKRDAEMQPMAPHEMTTAAKNEAEAAWEQFKQRVGGYSNSVNGRCSPRDLQRWLGFEDYKAYRSKKESIHAQIVKDAMRDCLPGVEELFYDGSMATLLFRRNGELMDFKRLSEGQRNVAALVGDIAWKAAQLNPQLGGKALKETPGIVLIDELDMHLHPEWQRMIVRKLQEIFPEIQFICATHSPQIVGEVPAVEVRLLEDGDDYPAPRAKGIDSNRILEEVMNGTSRRAEDQQRIDELAAVINEENFDKAEELLEDLKATLGEADPEITRARTMMAFLRDTL